MRHSVVPAIVAAGLALVAGLAVCDVTVDALRDRAWQLAREERFGECADAADSLVALLESDPEAVPHELATARYLAETARFTASLDEADQRALIRADSLGTFCWTTGDYHAGLEAAERQLEIRKRLLPSGNFDIAVALGNIARHAVWLDRAAYAESCAVAAERISAAALGPEHPRTSLFIFLQGFANRWEGNYARAETLYTRALEIRRKTLGEKHRLTLDIASALGWLQLDLGRIQKAERMLRETMELQMEVLGERHRDVAGTMHNLALALMWLQRLDEADAMFKEEMDIYAEMTGDPYGCPPYTLHCYAAVRGTRGDNVTAEKFYRLTMERYAQEWGAEHPRVGETMNDLAGTLRDLGRYAESDSLCLKVIERWPDNIDVSETAYTQLSITALQRGAPIEAEELTRKALALTESFHGPGHFLVAQRMQDLAICYSGSGDLVSAESVGREALARLRAVFGDNNTAVGIALQNLADIHATRGDVARATAEVAEALEICRRVHGGDHISVSNALGWYASMRRQAGDYDAAIDYQEQALAMVRRMFGDEHPRVASCLSSLARIHTGRRDFRQGEILMREAVDVARRTVGEENSIYAGYLSQLAGSLLGQGDADGAEPLLLRAQDLLHRFAGAQNPQNIRVLRMLGGVHYLGCDYAAAEDRFARAAELHDLARLKVGTGMERASYGQRSPYVSLAAAQLQQGKWNEAWASVERTSARALADLLAGAGQRRLTAPEAASEDSLAALVAGLETRIRAYLKAAEIDSTAVSRHAIAAAREELAGAEASWSRFRHEMAERYPASEGRVLSLPEVQKALARGTALVGWLDHRASPRGTESWIYVVRDRGGVAWASLGILPPDAEEPGVEARIVRDQIADPASSAIGLAREARGLWKDRFAPIADALEGATDLVIVPSGPLLGVPVESLMLDDGRLVGDVFDVSYTPSASVYARLGGATLAAAPASRALLVGDPPFAAEQLAAMDAETDAGWELLAAADGATADCVLLRSAAAGNADALSSLKRLRGTRAEVMLLDEMMPGARTLLGPDADERDILGLAQEDALAEFGTIHIATHALVDDEDPKQSALVLSQIGLPDPIECALTGERIYDGLLTAQEIVAECDLNADLVTLSACETGLGKKVVGEGYVGLAQALLQAGARSVVVSLWKVEDRATALLMQRFYENRSGRYEGERAEYNGEPIPKAAALAEAKSWLRSYEDASGRRPYEHPYYWSAFILIGARE